MMPHEDMSACFICGIPVELFS